MRKHKKTIRNYFIDTIENKVWALVLMFVGVCSAKIANDSSFLVVSFLFGIPLLLTKHNVFRD